MGLIPRPFGSRFDSTTVTSSYPKTDAYCKRLTGSICSPLDVVIWNNQTPTSSLAHLEPLSRSRYGPVSG